MSKFKKSAIKVLEYQNFIDTIDSNKIVYYWKQTIELCNSWYGVMTKEKLKRMESEPHFFNAFLDYDVINKRVKIERDDQVEISINNIETLSNKIPELITIQKALSELITQLPNDINKAESWLLHSAMNPGLSSDLEATIYFVSKGDKFDFLDCIKENLRIRMNNLVESTPLLKLKDKKVKNRAINRQILIPEATEILYQNDSLPRLLYFRDNEDELIDSTFIRAIDILCLTGFERWVESYIKEIEQAYTYLDKRYLVLYLFQLCRSDFILRSAKKTSIEILLHSLSIGQVESERPWKVSWFSQNANDPLFVDYYRIACVIVFSWVRIKPSSLNTRVFSNAIQTIFESQLASGAWPLASNSIEGDIITTCLGIYAVVTAKPKNWLESAQKAKSWLLSQINEVGCWHIEGGPITYINTFCLEAILMINEPDKASFTVPEKCFAFGGLPDERKIEEVNIIVFCEGSLDDVPLYQFDAECYSRIFINEFPNVKFLSIGNCHDVINDSNQIIKSITRLLPASKIIKLIDRDNRSESEIQELRSKDPSIKVLDLRSIENYILDDEVIRKFCSINGNSEKFDEVIEAKNQALQESITRNNPSDDIKSASGPYYNSIKRILNLTKSGNNGYGFMLYSLVPLITNDLDVYSRLKENIFE